MDLIKQFYLMLLVMLFQSNLFSQQNTTSTGGEASGIGGTVNYSVGQIDFSAQSGTNGNLNQGVQQPLEFFNLGFEGETINFNVQLFPNPTVAHLHVNLTEIPLEGLSYVLSDFNGKIIETRAIDAENLIINLAEQSRATYILNFIRKGKVEGTYQIIKN